MARDGDVSGQRGSLKALVTGGLGFIGSNLAFALLRSGIEVRILDNGSNPSGAQFADDIEVLEGDLCDLDVVLEASKDVEAIVHLGALGSVPRSLDDPKSSFAVNALGTLNVLEAARKWECHILMASSSSVYGRNRVNPKVEDMWVSPMSPYAASKLAAESLVLAYGESFGMDVLVFRFFNVFGPWQRPDHVYAAVIPKWFWRAIHNLPIALEGDGRQSRDFTSVHSVTDVLVDAIRRRVSYPTPVNLAFGNCISLLELRDAMEAVMGCRLEVQARPPRIADVQVSQNNPELLKKLFPAIQPHSFESTLVETYEWLRSQQGRLPEPE